MNKQPSLFKIITIDYTAFLALLFPVAMWGMYVLFVILRKIEATNIVFLLFCGATTVIAIAVLGLRIHLFNTVFDDGIEIPATISNVMFFRGRGRIDYVYSYQDQKYVGGNAVLKGKQTQMIQIGSRGIVMVDRNNPKRAFLRDLYINSFQSNPADNFIPRGRESLPSEHRIHSSYSAGSTMEIKFKGEYDKATFFKAASLANKPTKRDSILRISVAVLIAAIFIGNLIVTVNAESLSSFNLTSSVRRLILLLFAEYFILQPYIGAFITASTLWKDPSLPKSISGIIAEQGIIYYFYNKDPREILWERFAKLQMTENLMVLLTAKGELSLFPRHFFKTDDDWKKAKQWITNKVKVAS